MRLFTAQLDSQLSQGDLFAVDWDKDRSSPNGSVLVLSEGCDIEHSPSTVLVANTFDAREGDQSFVADVKAGKVYWGFYLDGMDRWVSLRTTHPEDKALLEARLASRLCSMLPEGRVSLAGKYFSFLTHSLPPKAKYFRDSQGLVWDVWEVRTKDVGRLEDQFRKKLDPSLAQGWLCITSSQGTRRLIDFPFGWQYLSDTEMTALVARAVVVDPKDGLALAAEAAARHVKKT